MNVSTNLEREQGEAVVSLLESALFHFRTQPLRLTLVYYLGTGPFVLGFMWFWAEMSRGAYADERCGELAFGLALLYLGMKLCHGVYGSEALHQLMKRPAGPWTLRRLYRVLCSQAWWPPLSCLLLPVSLFPFLLIPLPWLLAFSQSVSIVADSAEGRPGQCARLAFRQAWRWPGQNHGVIVTVIPIAFLTWLNLTVLLASLPSAFKTLLGIETPFTWSVLSLFNSTFLLSVTALTYLVLDPWIKWIYAIRCFQGDSLRTGLDLLAAFPQTERQHSTSPIPAPPLIQSSEPTQARPQIQPRTPAKRLNRVGLWPLVFLILLAPQVVQANSALASIALPDSPEIQTRSIPGQSIQPDRFRRSLEEVLERPEYRWRQPREIRSREERPPRNVFERIRYRLDAFSDWLEGQFSGLGRHFESWLRRLFSLPNPPSLPSGEDQIDWGLFLKMLMGLALAIATALLIRFGLQVYRRRPAVSGSTQDVPASQSPDLTDEQVTAQDLPEEEWFALANKMRSQGELRLALRALYLSLLAHLSRRELLRLARHKTNQEYARELSRRARWQVEVLATFQTLIHQFDRVWYGTYPIPTETLDRLTQDVLKIRSIGPESDPSAETPQTPA